MTEQEVKRENEGILMMMNSDGDGYSKRGAVMLGKGRKN